MVVLFDRFFALRPGRLVRAAALFGLLAGLLGACAAGGGGSGGGACGTYGVASEADPQASDPTGVGYRLNPGDLVQISVWREEELDRQVLVQPDGSISFPLIGQIMASGRTASELEAEIGDRLERFIPQAVATVELLDVKGNKVFVMGEVLRPGQYQMSGPLTVVQAISLAGGFSEFAAPERIRVLRDEGDEEVAYTVDYDCVANSTNVTANVPLRAGDTVIVPGKTLGFF
ncbi:MAG: polysaccharide biosynthesis/export family protein [Geminicoccaceae bacterium]|nr:polysaccharide biosynthesis/export family protein [Geminicoccaceae bacterium]